VNPEIQGRILRLLMGGYRQDEVASIIALEYPRLDEFELEDLPYHIRRIAK